MIVILVVVFVAVGVTMIEFVGVRITDGDDLDGVGDGLTRQRRVEVEQHPVIGDALDRRLEELETLVCGFPGVDHTYAIQAGREVRVIVDSDQVNDREAAKMCKDIAKAIEETLTYPGEIRVTVMRESRTVEYAR